MGPFLFNSVLVVGGGAGGGGGAAVCVQMLKVQIYGYKI